MYQHTKAFSLIEVTVALLIFSVVMLGLMALQTRQIKRLYRSYLHSVATIQAQSMLERLRVNEAPTVRLRELAIWNKRNHTLLPAGHGSYACARYQTDCHVTVTWDGEGRQVVDI